MGCWQLLLNPLVLVVANALFQIASFWTLTSGALIAVRRVADAEGIFVPGVATPDAIQDEPPEALQISVSRVCTNCGSCMPRTSVIQDPDQDQEVEIRSFVIPGIISLPGCIKHCLAARMNSSLSVSGSACRVLSWGTKGQGCWIHEACDKQEAFDLNYVVYQVEGFDDVPDIKLARQFDPAFDPVKGPWKADAMLSTTSTLAPNPSSSVKSEEADTVGTTSSASSTLAPISLTSVKSEDSDTIGTTIVWTFPPSTQDDERRLGLSKDEAEAALELPGHAPVPYRIWLFVQMVTLVLLVLVDCIITFLMVAELLLLFLTKCSGHSISDEWTRLRTRSAVFGPIFALRMARYDKMNRILLCVKARWTGLVAVICLWAHKSAVAWLMSWSEPSVVEPQLGAFSHSLALLLGATALFSVAQERLQQMLDVITESYRDISLMRGMPQRQKIDAALLVGTALRTEFGYPYFMSVVPSVSCHPFVSVLLLLTCIREHIQKYILLEKHKLQDVMQQSMHDTSVPLDKKPLGIRPSGTLDDSQLKELDRQLMVLVDWFPDRALQDIETESSNIVGLIRSLESKLVAIEAQKMELFDKLHAAQLQGTALPDEERVSLERSFTALKNQETKQFFDCFRSFAHIQDDFDHSGEATPRVRLRTRSASDDADSEPLPLLHDDESDEEGGTQSGSSPGWFGNFGFKGAHNL